MKLALVHDYLIQAGGAERVLESFAATWPDAPIFVLLYDQKKMDKNFPTARIRTSILQRIPFALRFFKWLMPFMPVATEQCNLNEYDVVLSSTSAFAKGVITRQDALHFCYCHTPTRYLWSDTHSYVSELRVPWPLKKLLPFFLKSIRMWDRAAADRVDFFIANSKTVQQRIKKYYKRDSVVIHPPVDTSRYSISPTISNYYVAGGRLVYYKNFDLIVNAFNVLGLPLVIFGEGPMLRSLQSIAKANIQFVGRVNDDEKAKLYSQAIAYIHPQEEDFGITAVESMAAGRPVIAYRRGGATETIIDGETGVFFDEQTPEALIVAIHTLRPERFDPQKIRRHAEQYDTSIFTLRMKEYVETQYARTCQEKTESIPHLSVLP